MQINPQQPNNNQPIGESSESQPQPHHHTKPKKDFKEALAKPQKQPSKGAQQQQESAAAEELEEEKTEAAKLAAEKGKAQPQKKAPSKGEIPTSPIAGYAALASKEKQPVEEGKEKKKGDQNVGVGKQAPDSAQTQVGQPINVQLGTDTTSAASEKKPVSSVEQLIEVFEKNRVFNSGVSQIQVIPRSNETQISVTLQSGIKVDVMMAPGGHDLNIHISGLTATVQAAIDNPANQEQMRKLLIEKGFTVHQIITERGEQAPISTGKDQPSQDQGRGGRGGGGQQGQEGGGQQQQQPRR